MTPTTVSVNRPALGEPRGTLGRATVRWMLLLRSAQCLLLALGAVAFGVVPMPGSCSWFMLLGSVCFLILCSSNDPLPLFAFLPKILEALLAERV